MIEWTLRLVRGLARAWLGLGAPAPGAPAGGLGLAALPVPNPEPVFVEVAPRVELPPMMRPGDQLELRVVALWRFDRGDGSKVVPAFEVEWEPLRVLVMCFGSLVWVPVSELDLVTEEDILLDTPCEN